MSDTCHYCDRPALYLCDFVLRCSVIEGTAETCDRPLCEAHRKQIGQRFVCGTIEGAGADTVDLCPGHAMFPDGFKPDFEPVKTGGRGRAA